MESYVIDKLEFYYPGKDIPALRSISISVPQGQFVTICGFSGCGKTTLLRQLKPALAPHGRMEGQIIFEGRPLSEHDQRLQSSRIGFVMQNPDSQIVTAKVWHELAFGLESLGYDNRDIQLRVAETASFFGIHNWFDRDVNELSGGHKQLLNLASIMAMQPGVLILDEPTSQLDPVAAERFLAAVHKINQELGVTVIMAEQRLENVLPISDRVIVMDGGAIIADGPPREVGMTLKNSGHGMYMAMPSPVMVYAEVDGAGLCPVTVREGRSWLDRKAAELNLKHLPPESPLTMRKHELSDSAVEISQAWFRYDQRSDDVIKDLSLTVHAGEFLAIAGGNGAGKSTALSLIAGLNRPNRGRVLLEGKNACEIPVQHRFDGLLGYLPQDPKMLFLEKTVKADLYCTLADRRLKPTDKEERIASVVSLCRLDNLLDMHPYDLSGGEQQRAGLAKVLLLKPRILLLDEPTKGMDAEFKHGFAQILKNIKVSGAAIIMVSHDIEFCARHADRCALFFNGGIAALDSPGPFSAATASILLPPAAWPGTCCLKP